LNLSNGHGFNEFVFLSSVDNGKLESLDNGNKLFSAEMGQNITLRWHRSVTIHALAKLIKVVYSCLVLKKSPLPDEGPDVITISEAAKVLGVTEVTLRRWDASGKFKAHRHPVSGYRLYKREDVLSLRSKILGRS
jgi:excisionase family DNA binding protein